MSWCGLGLLCLWKCWFVVWFEFRIVVCCCYGCFVLLRLVLLRVLCVGCCWGAWLVVVVVYCYVLGCVVSVVLFGVVL